MVETHTRSVAKGITWRFIASATTVGLVYITTGSIEIAGVVGAFDVVLKLLFYYLHERAWGKVEWGLLATIPVKK